MEKIFENLVNDEQFAKIFPDNAHRCSVSSDQTNQNIPHQFTKILVFFRVRYLRRSKLL